MREELRDILRDAYIRERKLNVLYSTVAESEAGDDGKGEFFARARENQNGDLQLLQEINNKYENGEIDPSMIEKLGESLVTLRAGRKERGELLKQILEWETELLDVYKSSLRFLTNDDETRKIVNRILTVKLSHRRELMVQLDMF